MSASQEKGKRKTDAFDLGKANSKNSKNNNKQNKTARIATITVVIVAILFAVAAFINSGYLRQNFAAVTIDNVKYSVTDFNYYYQNAYARYYQTMSSYGDYASSMLPDRSIPLKDQIYDETIGQTWAEYFELLALDQMTLDTKVYLEAQKDGYQLSDDDKKDIEEEIQAFKTNALTYGYSDLNSYLKAIYGKGMDEKTYRRNVERTYLVSSYAQEIYDSFMYTPETLEETYDQNKDDFDTFTYRYFMVSAEAVNEEDYADSDAYDAAKIAALEAAGAKAEAYAAKITNESSFLNAAKDYDPETNSDADATLLVSKGGNLSADYADWMKDASRRFGDVSVFESTNGCAVVLFMSRSDNHYMTADVQLVLIKQQVVDETLYADEADDTAYNAAVETEKNMAETIANEMYQEWIDNGATQEQLTQLIETYAARQVSTSDSKLYENIYKGQMMTAIDDWIFGSARKAGDHTVVYSEPTGYFILNYIGQGERYSDVLAGDKLRDADAQAWQDSLTVGEPQLSWLMTFAR